MEVVCMYPELVRFMSDIALDLCVTPRDALPFKLLRRFTQRFRVQSTMF